MKSRLNKESWVLTKPIAHRGLHGEGAAENSKTAYARAIEKGYPIEMDVQLTSDKVVVCFHDDNLKRVTGMEGDIRDKTYDQIKDLKLLDTSDTIMRFDEFLNFVDGRVPLLIEIKQQKSGKCGIEKQVVEMLDGYKGEYVVQSFDPTVMIRIKKLRPQIIRGQLGNCDKIGLPWYKYLVVKYLPLNFLVKPDFINYVISDLPFKTKLPVIRWTIDTPEKLEKIRFLKQNMVFEKIDIN